ncbi:MAG: hypothetical protein RML32_04110 [Gammaproteobacteria bacterium]|nr:hypothetical protein [Gammaproteobacteria bacterium]
MHNAQLSAQDLLTGRVRVEKVELPVRGGYIYVRTLSVAEVLSRARAEGDDVRDAIRAKIYDYAANEHGERLFTWEQAAEALDTLAMADVSAIIEAGNRLNAVDAAGVDAAKKD